MVLSTNIDSTYPDDPTRPHRKIHQQDHDAIHDFVNAGVRHDGTPLVGDWLKVAAVDAETGQITVERADEPSGTGGGSGGDHPDADHTTFLLTSQRGAANGVASLDASTLVPDAQIPSTIARDAEVTSAVSTAVANLVASAPATLDTLDEIAAALQDNPDVITDLTTSIGQKVAKSLYDANTILAANSDDTPAALTVAEQTLVGRITGGNIAALSAAQIRTLLDLANLYQAKDTDLDAIAALTTAAFGRGLLEAASAAAARVLLGAAPTRAFASGYWYQQANYNSGTTATVNNELLAIGLPVLTSTTFDRIGCEVTTAAASSTIRLGIYADNGGKPGALIVDGGTVDSSSISVKEVVINQTLAAGTYWLAFCAQGGTPTVRGRSASGVTLGTFGAQTNASDASAGSFKQSGVSGALPNPMVISSTDGKMPSVSVRAA